MSAPRAAEGELSFGVARHHDQWLGDSTAASIAAASLAGRDWVWRVSAGATRLEACRVEDGRAHCRAASFGADSPDGRLAFVDPRGLGEEASRSLPTRPVSLRARAGGGVWVRGGSSVVGLYYCRADHAGPSCRSVRVAGAPFRPSQVLGVFALADGASGSDVLWAVLADREIVRCAVGVGTVANASWAEPRCLSARPAHPASEVGGQAR